MQLALLFSFLPSSFLEGMMSGAAAAFLQPWGEMHQLKAPQMADSGSSVLSADNIISLLPPNFLWVCVCVCVCVCVFSVTQLCLTLCDPMDCSSPVPLSWNFLGNWCGLPFPNSRGSSWLRDQTRVSSASCNGRQILYLCTTWEALQMGESRVIKVTVKINK